MYAVGAALLLGSVIASASRAGSALVVLEAAAVGVTLARQRDGPRLPVRGRMLQFGLCLALVLGVTGWSELRVRVTDLLSRPDGEALRVDAVRASLAMIRDRPWLGSGLGTWPVMYPRHAGFDAGVVLNQAHNDWLQWAAEGGLPFLALLLAFTACMARPAWRSVYGIGVLAFLLHATVDYPMQQRPALAVWFFAMAGAACAHAAATRTRTTSSA